MSDRFLIRFGVCCVVFATVVQYRQHALWFQLPDPYTHATVNVGRDAMSPKSEVTNPRSTHTAGGLPDRRTRCQKRNQVRPDAYQLVGKKLHPCRLV